MMRWQRPYRYILSAVNKMQPFLRAKIPLLKPLNIWGDYSSAQEFWLYVFCNNYKQKIKKLVHQQAPFTVQFLDANYFLDTMEVIFS
jgi:hypothetical protein